MNNNLFIGPFKDDLQEFYNFKVNSGYKYERDKVTLKLFDIYTKNNYPNANQLTADMQHNYLKSLDNNDNSKSSFASTLRQFAIYLNNHNKDAYVLPYKIYKRDRNSYEPHIFTDDEIARFFSVCSIMYPNSQQKNETITAIFYLLYCTGMRVSECCNIKIKDIDFNKNIITLIDTKNSTSRNILINNDLKEKLINIQKKYNYDVNDDEYFFRHNSGEKYNRDSIYHNFRKILYYAKIPHNGNGPRVHDFRFTFCVRTIKKLSEEGKDVNNYLPIIATYMGHKKMESTSYYFRFISELFPSEKSKIEEYSSYVVRQMEDLDE